MSTTPNSNNRYLYGTEAINYTTHSHALPAYEPNPLVRPRPAVKPKVNWVFALRLSLCGMLLFGTAISFVYGYSIMSTKQQQLKELKIAIRDIKSEISNTEAMIAGALNLDTIKARAASELKMSEPLPHQIIYIDLPKESYTTYGE